jgi:phenylpropionate dioxygenase-like ring-hydroxylating dioxygenase large terminal subunit
MTDLTDLAKLSAAQLRATLPLAWWFDPAIAQLEQRVLFDQGVRYLGHELMVPNAGDYQVLPWFANGKVLTRNKNGVHVINNVCRHRHGVLLEGRGNTRNIVCPLHRWSYDLEGKLLSAPHFPSKPDLNLERASVKSWNGLLYSGARDLAQDLAGLSTRADLDFSGSVFDRLTVEEYNFNWKTFLEPYLELYHVEPFHTGLQGFVDAKDFRWEFGTWHSLQVLGVKDALAKPANKVYKLYQEALLKYNQDRPPKYGAMWFVYFPNVMLEWYPHALVVSTVWPRGPQKCVNYVEFYYPEELAREQRTLIELHQHAYDETAREDAQICQRSQDGRNALWHMGQDHCGPTQTPMEDGIGHFYDFLRGQMAPHL